MTTTWAALAAGTALIYVTNRGGTTIDVIDAATNKVVHTIGNIESPEVVRFSPDGRLLYIFSRTDPDSNFLIVMDRKSEKIVKKVPLSGWANEAQTTKDGKLILVCIRNTGTKAEDTGALGYHRRHHPGEGKEHPSTKRTARSRRDGGWQVCRCRRAGGTFCSRL
jgi:YVTN family beta-propeller protein